MLVRIDRGEEYPVYSLSVTDGLEIEVPDNIVEHWERIIEEYEQIQMEMAKCHKEVLGEEGWY